jgi:hypothetical protein
MKLAMIVVLVTGCGATALQNPETLGEAVDGYNQGVRWGRYQNAAIHVPPEQRAQFVDDWDQRSKDLRITDFDIVKVVQKTEREARVEVRLEWYKDSEGTVHETRAMQTWERHGKLWLMVDEARVRGTEMPGLPEPIAKE